MGIQRSMPPHESAEQSLRKKITKREASNIPDAESKTLVIRMLKKCRGK